MADNTTVAEVRARILANLRDAGMDDARVYVAANRFDGFNIRVVHELFADMREPRRREIAVGGIDIEDSEVELLTPDDEEWYGEPFKDGVERVPGWPEALGTIGEDTSPHFASDLDEELERPLVVTFYSLRGGVGRSTALAAVAGILGSRGRRVLCIDMDFEAPGLPYLLGASEPEGDIGALYLLLALERDDPVDIREHVQRVSESDEVYCLPAGKLGVEYAQRLRLLDPDSWYREAENPLHKLLDIAGESSLSPDVVLIDSRTGMSSISAPLLFDVSDLSVICFYPHPQARRGTELLTRSILNAKSRRHADESQLSPEPRFVVSPVPPGPSAARVVSRAIEWIDEWMEDANRSRSEAASLRADELMHVVPYSPETAFQDVVSLAYRRDLTYGPIADWLEQLVPSTQDQITPPAVGKEKILDQLNFSTGTAEQQDTLIDDYVQTRISAQALGRKTPLVIGRKGTGKTAIFRWLIERADAAGPIVVYSPNHFRDRFRWSLSAEGFATVEQELRTAENWPGFWACYSALAAYLTFPSEVQPFQKFDADFDKFNGPYGELEVVDTLIAMLRSPTPNIAAMRWLHDIDASRRRPTFLLFDGLDTGFGNDAEGRRRRSRAVTGLLTFLTEAESRIPRLPFKVMLRFDIWQQLRFENKSHLFGRYVQLTWRDQDDYFKTALKQARRSSVGFRHLLSQAGVTEDVNDWDEEEIRLGWNLLVGERMKGGKTTFTRNWVWSRLSDGQGDHGPRALSQLFYQAVQWERQEEKKNSYDRSIVRPRALVPSLNFVSDEALEALLEEFPELQSLVDRLKQIGRTPVAATDLQRAGDDMAGEIDLALEAGLLSIYEGTQDDIKRYKVPDLYRVALDMTRKGQA